MFSLSCSGQIHCAEVKISLMVSKFTLLKCFFFCSCRTWQHYYSVWVHHGCLYHQSVQDVVHLQPRPFYEICHCYHRQCGEECSLHLLRSCLAGCVRCLSEVCTHLQGHPCGQRLAECAQLPQVCPGLLPC